MNDLDWGRYQNIVPATSTYSSSKRLRDVYEMDAEAAPAISVADEHDHASSAEEQVKQPGKPLEKKEDEPRDGKSSGVVLLG